MPRSNHVVPKVSLSEIVLDPSTQPRAAMDDAYVQDLADWLKDHPDEDLDAVGVVRCADKSLLLWDGWHRVAAYKLSGREMIPADIILGNLRDAQLKSFGANARHGLRRTNDDKRRAVESMLKDKEWSKWPDRKIAEACLVTHPFVGKTRKALVTVTTQDAGQQRESNGTCGANGLSNSADANGSTSKDDESESAQVEESDADAPAEVRVWHDTLGNQYPDAAAPALKMLPDLVAVQHQLTAVKHEINRLRQSPLGQYMDLKSLLKGVDNVHGALSVCRPHRVCPTCKGQPNEIPECKSCEGAGWVNRLRYQGLGDRWGNE